MPLARVKAQYIRSKSEKKSNLDSIPNRNNTGQKNDSINKIDSRIEFYAKKMSLYEFTRVYMSLLQ